MLLGVTLLLGACSRPGPATAAATPPAALAPPAPLVPPVTAERHVGAGRLTVDLTFEGRGMAGTWVRTLRNTGTVTLWYDRQNDGPYFPAGFVMRAEDSAGRAIPLGYFPLSDFPEWYTPRIKLSHFGEPHFVELAPGAAVEERCAIAVMSGDAPPAALARIARLRIRTWVAYAFTGGGSGWVELQSAVDIPAPAAVAPPATSERTGGTARPAFAITVDSPGISGTYSLGIRNDGDAVLRFDNPIADRVVSWDMPAYVSARAQDAAGNVLPLSGLLDDHRSGMVLAARHGVAAV